MKRGHSDLWVSVELAREIVDDLATAFEPLREIATEVSSGSTMLGLGWRVDHDDDRLALS